MTMHKVFKPTWPGTDRLDCAYLHGDGHVITTFCRRMRESRDSVYYAKAASGVGIKSFFRGRVVFHDAAMLVSIARSVPLPRGQGVQVEVYEPSVAQGSNLTKERGLVIGTVQIVTGAGRWQVMVLPELFSSGLTLQVGDEHDTKFNAEMTEWGGHVVVEVLDERGRLLRAA